LHKTGKNVYIHIQKLQDLSSTFHDFKIKAQNALIQLMGLKGMVKDMTKWQVQYKYASKKPSHLSDYQIACDKSIDRAQTLETTTTDMCTICEKLEEASQVAIRNNHLFQIEIRDGKAIPTYEYMQQLDDFHDRQKNEIQEVQQPSCDVLEQYVVTFSYQAVQR